jgi:hypothetical protein
MSTKTLVRQSSAQPTDALRRALAADCSNRRLRWAKSLDAALAKVEDGLHAKLGDKSERDGPPTMFENRLARQMEKLHDGLQDLLAQVAHLRQEIQCAIRCSTSASSRAWDWDVPAIANRVVDFDAIRETAASVLAETEKNAQAETKVFQEHLNTDLGGGD